MFKDSDWKPLCQLFSDEECVRYKIQTILPDWQTWRTLASYVGHWKLRGVWSKISNAFEKAWFPVS
jgi:hypothetical protein